jgi:hypothetical protein
VPLLPADAAHCSVHRLQEEDEAQQQLLNGSVLGAQGPAAHSGVCSIPSLPLSYELTGQTGSLMYMSPEVFKVRVV